MRFLPEFPIRVSMHGWVSELTTKAPSNETMLFLTMQNPISKDFFTSEERELAASVSDALVFDFLIDGRSLFSLFFDG